MKKNKKNRQPQIASAPATPPVISDPQQQRQTQHIVTATAFRFEGPLPPPAMLQQYNNVFPGCAEKMVQMAMSQSEHRQHLEKTVVEGNVRHARLAQILAFILGATSIGGGIGLIAFGKDVQGLVAIIGALVALTGVFIYGRRQQDKERAKKREEFNRRQPSLPFPQ